MSKTETKIITKPVIETYSSTVTSVSESVSIPPKFTKPVSTALVNEGEKLLLEGLVEGKVKRIYKASLFNSHFHIWTFLHSCKRLIQKFSYRKLR